MDKQLFDDAIGEVPPSTVDVDAVIVRGRRAVRLRRVANPAVAAGVAVVLLTGVVAYTMTRDDDGSTPIASTPTTTSAPTTPLSPVPVPGDRVGPPQCAEEPRETAGEAAARLSPAAVALVLAQRPDLELLPGNEYPTGTPREPLEFYQVSQSPTALPICDGRARFEASAILRGPEGRGMLFLFANPAWVDERVSCEGLPAIDPSTTCDEFVGSAGEDVQVMTFTRPGDAVAIQVTVWRKDGTEITAHIGDLTTASKHGAPSDADAQSLDSDQLVRIATDPALSLFPR